MLPDLFRASKEGPATISAAGRKNREANLLETLISNRDRLGVCLGWGQARGSRFELRLKRLNLA